jgi:parallel beta-helix repeat protein
LAVVFYVDSTDTIPKLRQRKDSVLQEVLIMRVKSLHPVILIVGLVVLLMQPVLAKDRMMIPEPGNQDELDPNVLPEDAWKPGQVEGTGTYFEIADSEYLNIAVESSEVVHLRLESIPEMIVMNIACANDATRTQLTLSGFEPSVTYYKYEDDYHNGSAIEMDSEGIYVYEQDISKSHVIFIQSRPSTKFIPTDTTIGVWDSETRIYTLIMDVTETIQIEDDNLTVDGAWHTVTGYNTGQGIYLSGRTGVTIQNLHISNFSNGIFMKDCQGNVLADNIFSENSYGVYMDSSQENELAGNTATDNLYGIYLYRSNGNNIGFAGIELGYRCDNNELRCNSSCENDSGFTLFNCRYNIMTDNTVVSNVSYGINLSSNCSRNDLIRNAIFGNDLGLYVGRFSNYNKIYNNNFIDNTTQAGVFAGTFNEYYLPAPVGGNYWNDWTSPDDNYDGFVDFAYIIASGGRDELPLTSEVALICNQPPVAQAGLDQVVVVGDTVVLDGSASYDANQDELDYSWAFESWPEDSYTELLEPTSVVTSFIADMEGEYVLSLIVNDGLADSEPDYVTVEAIGLHDAVVMALADISGFVSDIGDNSLRNKKLRKPLTNKVDAVIQMVDEGCYEDALKKLQHDILGKTNGCIEIGEPDKNDWITNCDEQQELYSLLITVIELLERLV